MTPDEFLKRLDTPAPAYLFLGPEAYNRGRCRRALIERIVPPDQRDDGVTRHDLSEVEFHAVLDDARSFSLFAPQRVIWCGSAEAVLPKGRGAASEESMEAAQSALASYLKAPTPGVVIVFDCSRFEFDGDDKAKLQRVQKFYAPVKAHIEFERFTPAMARKLALELARERKLKIGAPEIEVLVELLGADAGRVLSEIEKLALYAGTERTVSEEDIYNLAPNAKASTIFALVNALGRKDGQAALEALDVLVRDGEYLPLALSFLATQFRLALVAKEARLSGASQVQAHFTRQGTAMWRSRAEQVAQTASAFSTQRLRDAVTKIYETDKAFRDARPDDRTIMENFVLSLTA